MKELDDEQKRGRGDALDLLLDEAAALANSWRRTNPNDGEWTINVIDRLISEVVRLRLCDADHRADAIEAHDDWVLAFSNADVDFPNDVDEDAPSQIARYVRSLQVEIESRERAYAKLVDWCRPYLSNDRPLT